MWQTSAILMFLAKVNLGASLLNIFEWNDMDALIKRANIFLDAVPSDIPIQQVEDLDPSQDVKLIIHGYVSSRSHFSIEPLRNTYLALDVPNILLADWADAAAVDYVDARNAVNNVALHFGRLLNDFLMRFQIDRSAVHVIGHSLGAHIAGRIGDYFNGSLGRVTGLDPALPLFQPDAGDSLHASAAQFVDVIHTDFPVFGDGTPRGTVDFYPNFGQPPQPGCSDSFITSVTHLVLDKYSCSHNRVVVLYAESIIFPRSFPALPCSFQDILEGRLDNCLDDFRNSGSNHKRTNNITASMNIEDVVYMGESVSRRASGTYFLDTYATPPYGKGLKAHY